MIEAITYSPEVQNILDMYKDGCFLGVGGKELFTYSIMQITPDELNMVESSISRSEECYKASTYRSACIKVSALWKNGVDTKEQRAGEYVTDINLDPGIVELFKGLHIPSKNYARGINNWQFHEITGKNTSPNISFRTLNFYNRNLNGSYLPHYHKIVSIIRYYIENGYSKVWNNIRILERLHDTRGIGGLQSEYYLDETFRAKSGIFADTIHLNHGTPEKVPGTHSIVGEALYADPEKIEGIDYTPIELLYYKRNNKNNYLDHIVDSGPGYPEGISDEKLFGIIISALQQAEDTILYNSSLPEQQVHDLLQN